MPALTHPDALHFDTPPPSFWHASAAPLAIPSSPLTGDAAVDVVVIGAGYTGLSTALTLARDYHREVCVLEAGEPGWGASGRNGGFACIGGHKLPYATMIRRYGLDATRMLHDNMRDAVGLVRDTLTFYQIDAGAGADGEVSLAHHPSRMAELRQEQDFLSATFSEKTELLTAAELAARGMGGNHFHGGLRGQVGFGLHPLNYVRGLARAAATAGVRLCSHSQVLLWQETPSGEHVLTTAQGRIAARHVVIACNGYTPEQTLPVLRGRLLPALSNIIVTRPLTHDERAAQGWTTGELAYDTRILLHYFRLLPDGRFLFGGRGGTDSSAAGARLMRAQLTATFNHLFPAWAQVEITHFWQGFVCLSHDLVPYVGPLNDTRTVWTSLAYHGNGVAMASYCGKALADMMAGRLAPRQLSPVLTRRLKPFPLPAFRPLYLKGAYLWYGWKDGA
jgi:glycine/D-amino acid oxidase-like deaminating enzyme